MRWRSACSKRCATGGAQVVASATRWSGAGSAARTGAIGHTTESAGKSRARILRRLAAGRDGALRVAVVVGVALLALDAARDSSGFHMRSLFDVWLNVLFCRLRVAARALSASGLAQLVVSSRFLLRSARDCTRACGQREAPPLENPEQETCVLCAKCLPYTHACSQAGSDAVWCVSAIGERSQPCHFVPLVAVLRLGRNGCQRAASSSGLGEPRRQDGPHAADRAVVAKADTKRSGL